MSPCTHVIREAYAASPSLAASSIVWEASCQIPVELGNLSRKIFKKVPGPEAISATLETSPEVATMEAAILRGKSSISPATSAVSQLCASSSVHCFATEPPNVLPGTEVATQMLMISSNILC